MQNHVHAREAAGGGIFFLDVHGLGQIGRGVGELILAVLAQVADMERLKISGRCESGRVLAKEPDRADYAGQYAGRSEIHGWRYDQDF